MVPRVEYNEIKHSHKQDCNEGILVIDELDFLHNMRAIRSC